MTSSSSSVFPFAPGPNVVVAASNAYDDVYLRRTTGIAPVPWPGTSPQLAATPYTGTRSEVLFCCGNHAYNKAIRHWAALIANGSAARAAGTGSAPVRFAWLSELYTKSDQCRRAPTNATASRVYARSKVCGYSYEDVASHPLAVLLPYSMHSYGLVQAYSLGIPLLAPSLRLLSALHVATGLCSHKGPGNTPWRPSSGERRRVPFLNRWSIKDARAWFAAPPPSADVPCCASEPNDACTPAAAAQWLQFAEWYQWPHVTYFDSPQELHAKVEQLLRDESARRTISDGAKAFFAAERERTAGHVRAALQRSLRVAPARAAPREREGVPVEAEAPRHLQQPPAGRDVRPRRNEEGAAAGAAGVPDYLVGPFAFNNACVSFYADRASQLRPSVTSEAGDSAMLHGFSEYTLGYQRVLKVRPAEATDQLRRCERRSLGVLVPFSCNNVYHMAFHALSADPRRWHAWEWALRAMTPRAEVAADSTPRRGLTNEGALLDALRRAGLGDALRPTTLEALPVAAQAREVAAAAGLVAVHGQALAWVLFLPWAERRTAAVELRPRGAKANIYEALSAALGVRYERVAATLADSCPSARWLQCNVTASPQKVTAALEAYGYCSHWRISPR
ncbi:hypothetical protein EMIHUDRAFT_211980 [Emiliania huxleyi CCMP1516]|uniref:Uncharacterized protein n=2 Tax=Emiliania huxleyi TaxID=2903 RepID=A0A0D3IS07_EMIH1|nr:hypothetical protein EMIHUDRAFT_211980 [Emiliania huxleyi CCMP1516]EOD14042.1 hypothetical protein EMIHUDRAFT_211980 [Emiliania huxleyi CCMP1516]|eukprot:XP_005766471.1 hypothetical protein EMIHUDRAFT_211980 [Emiliania huxleyi CCMP1516]